MSLKVLFSYLLEKKALYVPALTLISFSSLMRVLIPIIIGIIIDLVAENLEDADKLQSVVFDIGLYTALIVGLYILRGFSGFVGRYWNGKAGEGVVYRIREDLFAKLQYQSQEFYDGETTGALMTRATTDMEQIQMMLMFGVRAFAQSVSTFALVYLALLWLDVRLFGLMLIMTPVLFLMVSYFPKRLRQRFYEARKEYGNLTAQMEENIAGAKIVRAFSAQNHEIAKFEEKNDTYLAKQISAFRIRSFYLPLMVFMLQALTALFILFGGYLVVEGLISVGVVSTTLLYMLELTMPIRFLSFGLVIFQRGRAAADRIVPIMTSEPSIRSAPEAVAISDEKIDVEFRNVTFAYPSAPLRPVIQNLSFKIGPGDTLAMIGPTGSGKSTIAKLLVRLYDVQKGQILINGVDIRQIDLKSLREKVAVVYQDVFLFSKTLLENLRFGNHDADIEDVEDVIEVARIDEFLPILDNGLETRVGERGINLSGGQRQRIALGRALVSSTPIMVLDDFSSAIDVEIESQIQSRTKEFFKDRLTILITQRLSTLRMADRIIILNKGQILEQGSHEELTALGGVYEKLWKSQETGVIDFEGLFGEEILGTAPAQEVRQ